MRKGQRPRRHTRRIMTKKGIKKVLINKDIRKLTNKQYKFIKKTKFNADFDKDGIKNKDDCRPFDETKHRERFCKQCGTELSKGNMSGLCQVHKPYWRGPIPKRNYSKQILKDYGWID